MKLFDVFKKKKEKNNNMRVNKEHKLEYAADSIVGQWEDGKISAEDVMLYSVCDFYKNAMEYTDGFNNRKSSIEEHNAKIERMKGYLKEVKEKDSFPGRTVTIMLLQSHKDDINHLKQIAKAKIIYLHGSHWAWNIVNMCKKVRDDEGLELTKEGFLKYCSMDAIKSQAEKEFFENSSVERTEEEKKNCHPTKEQLEMLYDMAETLDRVVRAANGKEVDLFSFLTSDYTFQLPDENGAFHEIEENLLEQYIEMDYEGVV